jgi:hypothetical protein
MKNLYAYTETQGVSYPAYISINYHGAALRPYGVSVRQEAGAGYYPEASTVFLSRDDLQKMADDINAHLNVAGTATATLAQAVEPAGQRTVDVPDGFALVPLAPNSEMVSVMAEEEWKWEDLLAAAEAITEDQYNDIATQPTAGQRAVGEEIGRIIERVADTNGFDTSTAEGVDALIRAVVEEVRAQPTAGQAAEEILTDGPEGWRHGINSAGQAAAGPINGIQATHRHDEGAIACCSYCGRYSLDPKTLSDRQPVCDCGKQRGWSGSFRRPGPDAKWSGAAPTVAAAGPVASIDTAAFRKLTFAYAEAVMHGTVPQTSKAWGELVAHVDAAKLAAAPADAIRLEFMMEREAWIAWGQDGERCRVFSQNEDGDAMPMLGWRHPNAWHADPREAIDVAIAAMASPVGAGEKGGAS